MTALLGTMGCAAETSSAADESATENVGSTEKAGATSEALTGDPGAASWSQGQAPVYLQPYASGPCFLTSVRGKFRGSGESVYTYWKFDDRYPRDLSHANWFLYGSSGQSGVGGSAACIQDIPFSDRAEGFSTSWKGGQWDTRLIPGVPGTSAYQACFLSSVSGEFEGSGERVSVQNLGGSWYFEGSALSQNGVTAGAICVRNVRYTGAKWAPENAGGVIVMNGLPSGRSGCFLQGMTGQFNGSSESVSVFVEPWVNKTQAGVVQSRGLAPSVNALGGCIY